MKRFEPHCHSMYSNLRLLDCINRPKDIILTASKLGYSGVALTDHEALCGHVKWLKLEEELKKQDLIPKDFKCALGNEIYLTKDRTQAQKYYHFILIAKNTEGHRALRELSSNSWLHSYYYRGMERVPTLEKELEDMVHKYPNTLIASSACLGGRIPELVLQLVELEQKDDMDAITQKKIEIRDYLLWLKDLFGEDFYIEIAPGDSKDQIEYNKRIKRIASYYGIKQIIGTDAHYLTEDKRSIHKAFLNAKDGDREVDSFYKNAYLMSNEEIIEKIKLAGYTEQDFEEMCNNSNEIYEKIESYNIFHSPIIPECEVVDYPIDEDKRIEKYVHLFELKKSDNIQERCWVNDCLDALEKKGKWNDRYLTQLDSEADVLSFMSHKLNNCMYSYFNTFKHYIDLFWECGSIVGPGRGSATGFLSNYLLGITQIDPIVHDLADFRFLNKERVELPDIDIDLCPSKIDKIFSAIRKERGSLNLIQVATFGLETSKAAIATACRGYRSKEFPNGIDIDVSQYMSSLVPVERGFVRGISDCIYGNEEKDWKPIQELVSQFEQYPGLLDIVLEIEGLVCRRGIHASGVMFYNNSPYDTTALMRSPNGDITTQFDLGDSESLGDTKFDLLKTKISDKISITIDLLQDAGYFEKDLTKREIYNKYLHPENINLNDDVLWDALENGNVQSVFQFNTAIGIQTVKAIKPRSIVEMTAANALLRLAAQEGLERPLDRYIRFKNDIHLWYNEMDMAGLSKEEQKILEPYYLPDYGVPNSQEALMRLCMDEKISHFTLGEANAARKIVGKKKIKEIPKLKEKFLSQCPNENFGEYVWQTMMAPQMSYAFSLNHSLAYSFIGVQTLILATHYPEIVWDTACLIVDAQSIEEEEEEEEIDEEIDELDDEEEDEDDVVDKKDKKSKARDYGKVATAIGEIVSQGISMAPPDINNSRFTFYPDIEHNKILCGISSVSGIGISLVNDIISNRYYSSLEDFISKNNLSKPKMINLIKSGAFDSFGDRIDIMKEYCYLISDTKKRITLQNMKMLIDYGLLPPELDFERRVYNFTKYLKKNKLDANFYNIDEVSLKFISEEFDVDILNATDNGFKLNQKVWDKIYNKYMDNVRAYIKVNQTELLDKLNTKLSSDVWKKYCSGNISKWEMDSISCYLHEHELAHINTDMYGIGDFTQMPEEPEIESIFNMKGRNVPIYKIERIAGTVLDKDKIRKTVTLLTTTGVVTVKIYGTGFAFYDKQISEIGADGKKHIIEKSMFTRGNKLIVTGIRKENDFILKKYKRTPYHLIERIVEVHDDGTLVLTNRAAE